MNDFERFLHAAPSERSEAEAELRELLQAAGPRPEVPGRDFAEIKEAARSEWLSLVGSQQSANRWGFSLALAASLVLALAGAWWWRLADSAQAGSVVASVLRVEGKTRIAAGSRLEVGSTLPAGAEIETGADGARLALRLSAGQSVRLDQNTLVRLTAADQLMLEQGAIYFDSADAAGGGIEITTAFGIVRDIGTQFEVRIGAATGERLQVRVREGAVALERGGNSHSASVGEELRLQGDGAVVVSQTSIYGEEWAWAQDIAPAFDIDGQSLSRYLEWVRRETGWKIGFEDPELGTSVASVILSGTIAGLTPRESLGVILPASGMDHRLEGGALVILAAAPADRID